MSRRLRLHTAGLVAAALLAVAAAPAVAMSGGSGLGPAPGTGGGGLTGAAPGGGSSSGTGGGSSNATGISTVQASGDGISVSTRAAVLLRARLRFSGQVAGAGPSSIVEIERRAGSHGAWIPTAHGPVAADGSFTAVWPADHSGRFAVRAVVQSSRGAVSRVASASPALTVTVYKPAIATTFGPGFWGSQTACGQTLRHSTLGVANRTLPCGTPVSLLWHGHTVVVPVIDRGPYANGADWDLTSATATALGIDGTVTLGAVPLSR